MADNYTPNLATPEPPSGVGGSPKSRNEASTNTVKVATGPCRFISVIGRNNNSSSQYIQVHDSPDPSAGATPKLSLIALGNKDFFIDAPDTLNGISMINGLTITNSTTRETFTAGAEDCSFEIQYRDGVDL